MIDDLDVRLGHHLRDFRLRVDLSIAALARLARLPPETIGHYEAGRRRIPVETLARLAEILRVSVPQFFA